ncbi:MAG: thioredoxin domain-containing protein [Ignavibacteria bacterium]|nr:thioredoxin domain-containing protein [Ignavibacteria bacterium]
MNTKKTNNLINEKSPYLLQHAHNPVDWHAWNDETLKHAREINKPIFLSIGYSTCYWCHVMERECFENPDIAAMLNNAFVNIKVDREERPDIDRVYMSVLQTMTGSGGWPMSLFLTPGLKPFYAATYIPPKAKYGRAGFEDIITQIENLWNSDKQKILDSSENIFNAINEKIAPGSRELDKEVFDRIVEQAYNIYDEENGGFGAGNKFPRPAMLNFLLAHYHKTDDLNALDMVIYTLKKMYDGGIYDNIDGGFHRYAVDSNWRVPHFEKMLYDQAQIAAAYFDTYSITKKPLFLEAGRNTLDYVKNFLLDSEGGFYSAEDAESIVSPDEPGVKQEGFFYTWEKEDIDKILGVDKSKIFCYRYGILHKGNTLSDPHNIFGTKNVLYKSSDIFNTAKKFELSEEETQKILDESLAALKSVRDKRVRPFLDKKIITSWNAMMISAFVKGYMVSGEHEYKTLAVRAVSYLIYNLYNVKEGKLYHRSIDGEVKFDADLADYALLIKALLDFHNVSFSGKLLKLAQALLGQAIEKFYDETEGGFFDSDKNNKDIILKTKDIYDGAEPAGNSIMLDNLVRAYVIFKNDIYRTMAEKCILYFSDRVMSGAFSSPQFLCSFYNFKYFNTSIILTGNLRDEKFIEIHNAICERYMPNRCMIHFDNVSAKILPYLKDIVSEADETKVYLCENFSCKLPVSNIDELENILK